MYTQEIIQQLERLLWVQECSYVFAAKCVDTEVPNPSLIEDFQLVSNRIEALELAIRHLRGV